MEQLRILVGLQVRLMYEGIYQLSGRNEGRYESSQRGRASSLCGEAGRVAEQLSLITPSSFAAATMIHCCSLSCYYATTVLLQSILLLLLSLLSLRIPKKTNLIHSKPKYFKV